MTADHRLLRPALDEDALAQARALISGTPIRIELWNHEASRDSIRHYAWGIGDDNPLYCDPDYAAGTRWAASSRRRRSSSGSSMRWSHRACPTSSGTTRASMPSSTHRCGAIDALT